ncbi:hypothetical protein [Arenimonas sp. GDDSR-1]|uniref:hypothetical protein n=1 Tax=Arenimonas sp. GDDSR-1 TaxID=2950125 RepID=UPI00260EFB84|nr:hypothetical protein [Arenimonas sp. GDDSR-1]
MSARPKWYLPVSILALLWNLMGCAAYLSDVMLSPADIAAMDAANQTLYNSRPAWAVAATAVAVWGGAAGCLGLILRKRWSAVLLELSLAGVIVQDIGLFILSGVNPGSLVMAMQGFVLLVAIGLVVLSRRALARGWIG